MPVAVVVELPPADKSSPYESALIETCNIGMRPRGSCVLGEDATPPDSDVPIAIITWDGAARREVRIEVGVRLGTKSNWVARVVSFSSGDPEMERWRAAGFALATLVGEAVARGQAESKVEPPPTAPSPSQSRPQSASRPPHSALVVTEPAAGEESPAARAGTIESDDELVKRSWVDVLYTIASGADGLAPAQGAAIRFSRLVDRDNRWFVTGAAHFSVQPADTDRISILRSDASVAGGLVALRFTHGANVALRAGVIFQLVEATGTDSATGASGSGGRWVGGLAQGAEVAWMWTPTLGLAAGAEVSETIGTTEIRSHGHLVARVPAVDVAGEGGLRVAFP